MHKAEDSLCSLPSDGFRFTKADAGQSDAKKWNQAIKGLTRDDLLERGWDLLNDEVAAL